VAITRIISNKPYMNIIKKGWVRRMRREVGRGKEWERGEGRGGKERGKKNWIPRPELFLFVLLSLCICPVINISTKSIINYSE
jgi:hypothetical protein